jgi:hypothetical protein
MNLQQLKWNVCFWGTQQVYCLFQKSQMRTIQCALILPATCLSLQCGSVHIRRWEFSSLCSANRTCGREEETLCKGTHQNVLHFQWIWGGCHQNLTCFVSYKRQQFPHHHKILTYPSIHSYFRTIILFFFKACSSWKSLKQ